MDKVTLKSMKIKNFKGIASFTTEFDPKETKLYGKNGEGKTTLKEAWQWVLCQNIDGVVPNINNKEIVGLTTAVEAVLGINGVDYTLARERKDKFDGNKIKVSNDNIYKIDGIEIQQKQYQSQIANLIGECSFENLVVLTDKKFFNSDTTKWKWTDRRKLLFKMCNVDQAIQEIKENPKYKCIKEYIDKNYATSDIKSMFRKEKDTLKKEQDKNLILIEQKQKEIDEFLGIDFQKVSQDLAVAKIKHTKMLKSTKNENNSEQLKQLQEQQLELYKQLSAEQTKKAKLVGELREKSLKIYNEACELSSQRQEKITEYNKAVKKLEDLKSNKEETVCPTCKQKLPSEIIEKTKKAKEETINELEKATENLKEGILQITKLYNSELNNYNEINAQIKAENENQDMINAIKTDISDLNNRIEDTKAKSLNKLSSEELSNLENTISALEQEFANLEFIKKGEAQIKLWKTESKEIADKVIAVEEKEIALQDFMKEQTDRISKIVNEKFSNGITWSLYTTNYNGSLEEDCICLYNKTRYQNLSDGEKCVADIEVVKTLQDYFDVNIPIFCDKEEGVTIEYNTDRQIIGLYTAENAKLKGCVKIKDLY